MPQELLETLRLAYGAISRGDWDAAFEAAEPDFEFVPPGRSAVSAPGRGVEELIEAGEFIVALLRLRIRPHAADADFELQIAHLWTLRDGKLIRCEVFPE